MGWKSRIESLAERLGYRVTPLWREDDLALERHLIALFKAYGITTVLDVGANAGQFGRFLRQRVGFRGIIHSFEPQPQLAQQLRREVQSDPAWHVHAMGLGSEDAQVTLNLMASDRFSSFRMPDNQHAPQFESSNRIVGQVEVPVRRLDGLALGDLGQVYLKTDTQGFDLEVLRGAAGILKQVPALQFELPLVNIYAGVPGGWDMLQAVEAMGFAVSGFFPVSADAQLRMIEMDCVMVPRKVEPQAGR